MADTEKLRLVFNNDLQTELVSCGRGNYRFSYVTVLGIVNLSRCNGSGVTCARPGDQSDGSRETQVISLEQKRNGRVV